MTQAISIAFTPASLYLATPNEATLAFTLSGGTIAAAPGELAFDVSFAELYTDPAAQAAIVITAAGWTAQFQSGMFFSWLLTPDTATEWLDGTTLTFAVSALTPDVEEGDSYFVNASIDVAGTGTYESAQVSVETAGAGDLRDILIVTVDTDIVYGTKTVEQVIENQLVLSFLNDLNGPVVPEDEPWEAAPPEFTVSFSYAPDWPGTFALTTPGLAAQFEVATTDPAWSVTLGDGPKWILRPETHAILQAAAGVSFTFKNIVTQFVAGPTQMFVQWANVPGYQDDDLSIPLYKEYKDVSIVQFQLNRDVFVVGDEPERAYLTWSVDHATMVELSGYGAVPREAFQFEMPVDKSGSFVLTAIDPITATIATEVRPYKVEPSLPARLIPSGTIMMWSGAEEIPPGFTPCDGTNGTPDLRDRFILAAGLTPPLDSEIPTHTHPVESVNVAMTISDAGLHSHPLPPEWYGVDCQGGSSTGIDTRGSYVDSNTRDDGTHTHTLPTLTRSPTSTTINTPTLRPRWYALLYIMKRYA